MHPTRRAACLVKAFLLYYFDELISSPLEFLVLQYQVKLQNNSYVVGHNANESFNTLRLKGPIFSSVIVLNDFTVIIISNCLFEFCKINVCQKLQRRIQFACKQFFCSVLFSSGWNTDCIIQFFILHIHTYIYKTFDLYDYRQWWQFNEFVYLIWPKKYV